MWHHFLLPWTCLPLLLWCNISHFFRLHIFCNSPGLYSCSSQSSTRCCCHDCLSPNNAPRAALLQKMLTAHLQTHEPRHPRRYQSSLGEPRSFTKRILQTSAYKQNLENYYELMKKNEQYLNFFLINLMNLMKVQIKFRNFQPLSSSSFCGSNFFPRNPPHKFTFLVPPMYSQQAFSNQISSSYGHSNSTDNYNCFPLNSAFPSLPFLSLPFPFPSLPFPFPFKTAFPSLQILLFLPIPLSG